MLEELQTRGLNSIEKVMQSQVPCFEAGQFSKKSGAYLCEGRYRELLL